MAKTIIRCTLGTIDDAIREIEAYERDMQAKVKRLQEAVAERVAEYAGLLFGSAVVDDLIKGPRYADVSVTFDHRERVSIVVANGEDAVWVEFGAGVYHNGSVGSSPHPEGARLGFTIGGYGKGYGAKRMWGYWSEDDELVLTRGTPAVMPMYNALKTVCEQINEIAKEVFA